jgi:hypothetical protein
MANVVTFDETITEIIEEVKKMDKAEQGVLLKNLRVKNFDYAKLKDIVKYDRKRIKPPTLEQIDKWKHEARKDPRYIK